MKLEWDLSELTKFANNLGQTAKFEREMKLAAKEIAAELLKRIKTFTPVGDTYQLVNGWNGNDFAVRNVDGGFEVLIVNKTSYALHVNDGHKAYNQYGGPYPIHEEVSIGPFGKLQGRIKVTKAHQWQKGDHTYYVFGHFFVERGILQLQNTTQVENIIMQELQKWWDSV